MVRFIGEPLVSSSQTGPLRLSTRIATAFPARGVIVTLPGIHATQRFAYTSEIDQERKARGAAPLDEAERTMVWREAVDLLVEGNIVLIRPDPNRMDQAFAADDMLQTLVPRRQIRFLYAGDVRVRAAINQRGEAWRIHPLPRSFDEMRRLIRDARAAVNGEPIYYYSAMHGTRILTCDQFARLADMPDDQLRSHMVEIAGLADATNARGWPELDLFKTEGSLRAAELIPPDVAACDPPTLREAHARAVRRLRDATPLQFQLDDPESSAWRNQMYRTLIAPDDDTVTDEDLLGLSDEYFMQIHWLPGARVDDEELIFDTDPYDNSLNDPVAHELICNVTREYEGIDFINVGRIIRSLSRRAPKEGRRDVYIVHFRPRGAARDELHIIRFLKWGVRERLDEGKPLLQAMIESEEYADYILDRRLACRQLGMKLAARVLVKKIQETYRGRASSQDGQTIWSAFIERDYIAGVASDKAPRIRLADPEYARQLAAALGRAAAPNLIVGRANPKGAVIFDDGDELLVDDGRGNITDVVVADPTGSFTLFDNELRDDAPAYAAPVQLRSTALSDVEAFTTAYLDAFVQRFEQIQASYRRRREPFDALFKHRRRDPAGNLAHRWAMILARLDRSDPHELARIIRDNISNT